MGGAYACSQEMLSKFTVDCLLFWVEVKKSKAIYMMSGSPQKNLSICSYRRSFWLALGGQLQGALSQPLTVI
jgi:hypothetical protein